jgi:hypothetical protein
LTLNLPLDVFVVRKLGVPIHQELAMGAIASGGIRVFNDDVIRRLGITPGMIQAAIQEQEEEMSRRGELNVGQLVRERRAGEAFSVGFITYTGTVTAVSDWGAPAEGKRVRPETERWSHYFEARLSDQFDAVIHFDETRAVEPLERSGEWEKGELPETYPSGY